MIEFRLTEVPIIAIVTVAKVRLPVAVLCRQCGIFDATLYNWHSKFSAINVFGNQVIEATEGK